VLHPSIAAAALCFTLAGCASAPRRLVSSSQLLTALQEGRQVRAVVSYARCAMMVDGKGQISPDATGGLTVQAFEHFASGVAGNDLAYTAVSETRVIVHSRYGAVLDYVRMRISSDGKVEVTAKYLKPPALEPVMEETFRCQVGDSVRLFAD
jgi:hypothetical protein